MRSLSKGMSLIPAARGLTWFVSEKSSTPSSPPPNDFFSGPRQSASWTDSAVPPS